MRNYFEISTTWAGTSTISSEDLTIQVMKFLLDIADVNFELFGTWWPTTDDPAKADSTRKISARGMDQKFIPLIEYLINSSTDDQVPEIGSRFSLWNGLDDSLDGGTTFRLNSTHQDTKNRIELAFKTGPEPYKVSEDDISKIVVAFKKSWPVTKVEVTKKTLPQL
ncbi:MAG: hypothetical protein AAF998_10460 [Bacteroidota bacterium]